MQRVRGRRLTRDSLIGALLASAFIKRIPSPARWPLRCAM